MPHNLITLPRSELYHLVWSKSVRDLAAEFGISDVALAKRCRALMIPVPPSGYWARVAAGHYRHTQRAKLTFIRGEIHGPIVHLDDLIKDWLKSASMNSGKLARLEALQRHLGISDVDASHLRYQLLHRTASTLKETERFGAGAAVMLVQSFNRTADDESWHDVRRFGEVMGAQIEEGRVVPSPRPTDIPLHLGWVNSEPAGLERIRAAI